MQGSSRASTSTLKWQGTVGHVTRSQFSMQKDRLIYRSSFFQESVLVFDDAPAELLNSCRLSSLPKLHVHDRSSGMDQDLFYDWAKKFVEEPACLRRNEKHILLVYDGFAGNLKYLVLQLFKKNRIIVAGLPAHFSHPLQPLDLLVFSTLKNSCKN